MGIFPPPATVHPPRSSTSPPLLFSLFSILAFHLYFPPSSPFSIPPTRPSDSVVLAEAAVTQDGDQASRGSWLRRISPRPTPPLSSIWRTVCIFHRLEILFARSAAKLSRFEIFMNGSGSHAYTASRRQSNKESLGQRA